MSWWDSTRWTFTTVTNEVWLSPDWFRSLTFPHKLHRMLSIVNSRRKHGFVLQRNGAAPGGVGYLVKQKRKVCVDIPRRDVPGGEVHQCVDDIWALGAHHEVEHCRGSEYNWVESVRLLRVRHQRRWDRQGRSPFVGRCYPPARTGAAEKHRARKPQEGRLH